MQDFPKDFVWAWRCRRALATNTNKKSKSTNHIKRKRKGGELVQRFAILVWFVQHFSDDSWFFFSLDHMWRISSKSCFFSSLEQFFFRVVVPKSESIPTSTKRYISMAVEGKVWEKKLGAKSQLRPYSWTRNRSWLSQHHVVALCGLTYWLVKKHISIWLHLAFFKQQFGWRDGAGGVSAANPEPTTHWRSGIQIDLPLLSVDYM